MESPIRYAMNRASITKDESLIKNLGPLAFALKSIVLHSNKERDDGQNKDAATCFIGTYLTDNIIDNFKSLVGQEINFSGFANGKDETSATKDVPVISSSDKVSVLFEISITDCFYNFFIVDRPQYSPYYK